MARLATLGLPWLVVMGFSATMAWALNTALTTSVPTTALATEAVPTVVPRSAASEACGDSVWMVYVGQGNWIHDPRAAAGCPPAQRTRFDDLDQGRAARS
jgi:hypothetical protein